MQFLAKFGQIIGWRPPLGVATPHLGNLDPVLQYSRDFTDKVAFMSCTLPRLSCLCGRFCETGGKGACRYQFQGLDSGNVEANDNLNRAAIKH